MKKLKPRTVDLLFWFLLFIGAIIAFLGTPIGKTGLFVTGIAIIIGAGLFRFLCFKCPHCGKRLNGVKGEYCPYCDKYILDE